MPPAQAEQIVDALWERHLPHAYLLFPGEDHGFRSAANIIRSFEAELSFYGQVFGFDAGRRDRADRGRIPRRERRRGRPGPTDRVIGPALASIVGLAERRAPARASTRVPVWRGRGRWQRERRRSSCSSRC